MTSCWFDETVLLLFEDTSDSDDFRTIGAVDSDAQLFFGVDVPTPNLVGIDLAIVPWPDGSALITDPVLEVPAKIHMVGEVPAFYRSSGPHGPLFLFNIMLAHDPESKGVVAGRFVGFAAYLHTSDAKDPWPLLRERVMTTLRATAQAPAGRVYETRRAPTEALVQSKARSVIVLGKDTGAELDELLRVRDYLRGLGYEARLIKDLPEIGPMSNEQKVRLFAQLSRFCVMVDRVPAGHIAEYGHLKDQRTTLAFLRPRGSGSTYMIGDADLVDLNYIRRFEFDGRAETVLAEAVAWAEGIERARESAYGAAYPWRGSVKGPEG